MDKTKAKLKAEQLMRLALGTHSSEEARTAAMSAVAIIARHGLVLSLGEPQKPSVDVSEFFRQAAERAEEERRRQAVDFSNWGRQARAEEDILDDGTWIRSKFNGHCASCGEPYYVGDRVLWKRGKGCMCHSCFEERRGRR